MAATYIPSLLTKTHGKDIIKKYSSNDFKKCHLAVFSLKETKNLKNLDISWIKKKNFSYFTIKIKNIKLKIVKQTLLPGIFIIIPYKDGIISNRDDIGIDGIKTTLILPELLLLIDHLHYDLIECCKKIKLNKSVNNIVVRNPFGKEELNDMPVYINNLDTGRSNNFLEKFDLRKLWNNIN